MALPYQWQMRAERLKRMFGGMFGGGANGRNYARHAGRLWASARRDAMSVATNLRFGLAAMEQGVDRIFWRTRPGDDRAFDPECDCCLSAEIMGTMHAGKVGGLSILWGMDGETLYRLGACYGPAIFIGHNGIGW